jgi:hypothetical protein
LDEAISPCKKLERSCLGGGRRNGYLPFFYNKTNLPFHASRFGNGTSFSTAQIGGQELALDRTDVTERMLLIGNFLPSAHAC